MSCSIRMKRKHHPLYYGTVVYVVHKHLYFLFNGTVEIVSSLGSVIYGKCQVPFFASFSGVQRRREAEWGQDQRSPHLQG